MSRNVVLLTDDGEKGCRHEEGVQDAQNARRGYLVVGFGGKADEDVGGGWDTRHHDGDRPLDSENKLEGSWREKTGLDVATILLSQVLDLQILWVDWWSLTLLEYC